MAPCVLTTTPLDVCWLKPFVVIIQLLYALIVHLDGITIFFFHKSCIEFRNSKTVMSGKVFISNVFIVKKTQDKINNTVFYLV